jgi:CRP-like cAMP-binding protein
MGDEGRSLFFLQNGFVKVGAITADGREVIYDVRGGGDVIGELCASEQTRPDRAVALEQTDAISVPFAEILELLLKKPELISMLIDVFCRALKEAYAQVNTLALDDTVHRLIKFLSVWQKRLASHQDHWWKFRHISRKKKLRIWRRRAEKEFRLRSIPFAAKEWCTIRREDT